MSEGEREVSFAEAFRRGAGWAIREMITRNKLHEGTMYHFPSMGEIERASAEAEYTAKTGGE